jgi:hypothetical protein
MARDFDVPTQIEAPHSDLFSCSFFFFSTPKPRNCHMLTYKHTTGTTNRDLQQRSRIPPAATPRERQSLHLHVLHPASKSSSPILMDSPNDSHSQFFLYQDVRELNLLYSAPSPSAYFTVSCSNFNRVSVVFQVNSSHQLTININMTAS